MRGRVPHKYGRVVFALHLPKVCTNRMRMAGDSGTLVKVHAINGHR
jgi:hypothetical protein